MKNIFITGATSGFGLAIAEVFAQHKFNLILTGRRSDKLELVANRLATEFGVKVFPLCFDIRKRDEVDEAVSSIPPAFFPLDILVNNAGLAVGKDPIHQADIDDWERMIDTNVKGLLYITRALVPAMVEAGNGHVINIGSTAGKEAYGGGSVYCASKHAVDAISKAMRIDLVEHGIKVTQICPGASDTEFSLVRFKGDKSKADGVYRGYDPLLASDIADITYFAATRPPHVCLNDIVVTPTAQANSVTIFRKEE